MDLYRPTDGTQFILLAVPRLEQVAYLFFRPLVVDANLLPMDPEVGPTFTSPRGADKPALRKHYAEIAVIDTLRARNEG
jgi:hypothetical protein